MLGRRSTLVILCTLVSAVGPADGYAQQSPAPCTQPETSQFDFWLGEWEVRAGGQVAGQNQITKEIGGCVLHERYTTPRGYAGESFNIYDASRSVWHQTWVDNQGALLVLEGAFVDGRMVLEGTTQTPDGPALQRVTWSLIEGGPNVRQHWEASTDDGETWTTAFDGTYVPKGH